MKDTKLFLTDQHWAYLRDRAVADDVAAERGYREGARKGDLERLGFGRAQQLAPALVIPIWSVRGEIESYQLRPNEPRLDKKGKPLKFEMKAGGRMLLDVHPRLSKPRDGCKVAPIGDPSVPLLVTEGIAKGDAAVSIDLCCIALLGVWNWRGSNQAGGRAALPDWEYVALNGRTVYLAFDSDVMQKPSVNAALKRLKSFLESRQGHVKLIYLPAGKNAKVGLDDYIAGQKAAGVGNAEVRDALITMATTELHSVSDDSRVGVYREDETGLLQVRSGEGGEETEFQLTNFTARIVADVTRDDGAETYRSFEIVLKQGARSATATVAASQFPAMRWPVETLGAGAIVYAGYGNIDQARCAIQLFSQGDLAQKTIFAHTGWRKVDDSWIYLHGGGAIGSDGAIEDIEVSLPPELSPFHLELPATDPAPAIRASLRLLDIAPDHIAIPIYGATIRSVLVGADFSTFLFGHTGAFKTEFAALHQSHFGAGFNARHLPANFTSTANTNEMLAFVAKDALFVVDELHPPGSGTDREAMHRDAARLLRAQGNAAGRGRMRADGSLRPQKPPRGLMLATGEELPRGQSVHVRLFTIEMSKGDIKPEALGICQADAAAGLYVQAMAAFIRWLAPRLDEVRLEFEELRQQTRAEFQQEHARTADIQGQLTASFAIFLKFLLETGVVDEATALGLGMRIRLALALAARRQAQFALSAEPTAAFIRLLRSAISSGGAHLADPNGSAPAGFERGCGWRLVRIGAGVNEREDWQSQGARVGWFDGADLFLDRDAAYQAAQRMAADGNGIEVSAATLTRRLRDKGLILTTDPKREVLTVRRVLDGNRREVLHLHGSIIGSPAAEPDQFEAELVSNGRVLRPLES